MPLFGAEETTRCRSLYHTVGFGLELPVVCCKIELLTLHLSVFTYFCCSVFVFFFKSRRRPSYSDREKHWNAFPFRHRTHPNAGTRLKEFGFISVYAFLFLVSLPFCPFISTPLAFNPRLIQPLQHSSSFTSAAIKRQCHSRDAVAVFTRVP